MKTNIKKRKKWVKTNQTTPTERYDKVVGETLVLGSSIAENEVIVLGGISQVYKEKLYVTEIPEEDTYWSCLVTNLGTENASDVHFEVGGNVLEEADFYKEVQDKWGNYYSLFKTFYRKNIIDNDKLVGFEIANYKKDDDFAPYPCFVDEQGNVLPYIMIGRYGGSRKLVDNLNIITSIPTQVTTSGSQIYDQDRRCLVNMGVGYQFFDANMHSFLRDLTLTLYKSLMTQRNEIFGLKTDYTYGVAKNPANCFIDGIFRYNNDYYYCDKPSKYVSVFSLGNTDYVKLSYSLINFDDSYIKIVKELGYDSRYPFVNVVWVGTPCEAGKSRDSDQTKYYAVTASSTTAWSGSTRKDKGLWLGQRQQRRPYQLNLDTWSNGNGYYRLCYRPISEEE